MLPRTPFALTTVCEDPDRVKIKRHKRRNELSKKFSKVEDDLACDQSALGFPNGCFALKYEQYLTGLLGYMQRRPTAPGPYRRHVVCVVKVVVFGSQ